MLRYISMLTLTAVSLAGCSPGASNGESSYDTTTASTLASSIAGASSSSDDSSGANVARLTPLKVKQMAFNLFVPSAHAGTCAATEGWSHLSCSSDVATLSLSSCTVGGATWTGSETLTFSAGGCADAHTSGMMSLATNATSTITSPSAMTRTNALGAYVETDSNSSGYSTAESGGLEITCTGATCASARSVSISGIHRAAYLSNATKAYDHTISTTSALTFTGTGSAREITGGTIMLQHNLAQYTASAQITSPLTFSAGCCIPTGGEITTTFSGSKTGSETVEFSSTCGVGTVNGTSFTATHCM